MSTVNLPAVIAAHKRRKAENSLNILTVVLSKVGVDGGRVWVGKGWLTDVILGDQDQDPERTTTTTTTDGLCD